MLKEMKKKSMRKSLLFAAVMVAVAAVVLWVSGFSVFRYLAGAKPLDALTIDTLEGRYVEAEIPGLWDYYAQTERTENGVSKGITEREYIFPVGEQFMGVAVDKNRMEEADDLLDRTDAVFNDLSDDVGEPMHVKGYVMQMDAQTEGFFYETVGYYEADSDYQEMFVPLVLRDGYVDADTTVGAMWLYTLIALAALGCGIFTIVKAATGGYQGGIKKLCAASPDPESALADLERFYEEAQPVAGIRANDTWVMLPEGSNTMVCRAEDVAWVHKSTTQHRVYFIPVGKSRSLTVWTKGGQKIDVAISSEALQDEAQQYLFYNLPGTVFGYSAQMEQLFRTDRGAFAEIAKQQHDSHAEQLATAQE